MNKLNSLFWVCLLDLLLSALAWLVSSAWDVLSSHGYVPSESCPSQLPPPPWSFLSLILPDQGSHTFLFFFSHFSLNYIIISQLSWHFTFCLALRFFMLPFPLSREPSEGRIRFWFLVAFPISHGSGLCTLHSDHMFNKRLLHTKSISGSTPSKFFWMAR